MLLALIARRASTRSLTERRLAQCALLGSTPESVQLFARAALPAPLRRCRDPRHATTARQDRLARAKPPIARYVTEDRLQQILLRRTSAHYARKEPSPTWSVRQLARVALRARGMLTRDQRVQLRALLVPRASMPTLLGQLLARFALLARSLQGKATLCAPLAPRAATKALVVKEAAFCAELGRSVP